MKSFKMLHLTAIASVSLVTSLFSASLWSSELETQSVPVVITNATIYTMGSEGTLKNASMVINQGKIVAMGKNIPLPMGVKYIDAKGGSITPGLFNSHTHIGLEEVSAIQATDDFKTSNVDITASLKIADAFNPNSVLIPHNRMHGLIRALIVPESGSGLIAGQAAIVDLSGGYQSVLNDYVALVVNLGEAGQKMAGGSRAAAYLQLANLLDEARDYAKNKQFYLRGQSREFKLSKSDLEALQPIINRKKPMLISVNRAADILQVLKIAKQQNLKIILSGVAEGWMVKQQIAEAGVPVILDPIDNLPGSYETLGSRLDNAALLQRAGVTLLFTGMGWQNTHNAYLVRQSAGNAVANGLSKTEALAAVTRSPAEVFGMKGYGVLELGAEANLVVWSGDLFEVTSEALKVFINGNLVPMQSRSIRLRDRYFKRHANASNKFLKK
jgi:imidazolonepropionase-like amidohydrolase